MERDKQMKVRDFRCPSRAEQHLVSDYSEYITKYSLIVPRKKIHDKTDFKCPRCEKKSEYEQTHGDAFECGKCGLKRQSFGNLLYLWE